MNNKILLTLTLLFGLSAAAFAQQAAPDTLYLNIQQAIEIAVKSNPDLKRVRMDEEILLKQIQGAKGSALPQVKGTGGFTDNFALPQQLLPGEIFGQEGQIAVKFGVRYSLNVGVEVNQILYNKEFLENIKKLETVKATYGLQTLATMEDLVYNVAQVYIQYQIAQEQKDILSANLARTEQLMKIAEIQFNNGIIKRLDVDQLKVNLTNLRSEFSNLNIGLEQQLNVLRFYLALSPDQPLVLNEKLNNTQRYPLSEQLLFSENINHRLLEQQIKLAQQDEKVIKAGFYPTLSAFARYNYNGQTDMFKFTEPAYSDFGAGMWGLSLSVPIFDGFQKKRKLQENTLLLKQLEYSVQNLSNASQMEFNNASIKIQQNEKQVLVQRENMELAKSLYEVSKLSYQEGVVPLTELLNAETSLKEAQSQYLTALLNFKSAELEHVKVSGQLAKMIQASTRNN